MMKRIGVIGAGRFGSTLAENLIERGVEVVLLDRNKDIVQRLSGLPLMKAVQGDATNEGALAEAGFKDCEAVVVAISENMEASIMATVMLKEMKVPYIVAKAASDIQAQVLRRIGADAVVCPEKDRAKRLARALISSSATDIFEIAEGVSIAEMKVPEEIEGKTLTEARIRAKYGVTVLVIRRPADSKGNQRNIVGPSGDDVIQKGDVLIVFGPDKNMDFMSKK